MFRKIPPADTQLAVLRLRLAELKNLVYKIEQTQCAGMNYSDFLPYILRSPVIRHEVFEGSENQGEGRAQLVSLEDRKSVV